MRDLKREVTIRIPLWCLLLVGLVAVGLLTMLVIDKTNFKENYLLQTLDEDQIISAYVVHGGGSVCSPLTGEALTKVLAAVNSIRLVGEPYKAGVSVAGGPYPGFRFVFKNGKQMELSLAMSGSGMTWMTCYFQMDGYRYFVGREDDTEKLVVYNQLMDLHDALREAYFKQTTE